MPSLREIGRWILKAHDAAFCRIERQERKEQTSSWLQLPKSQVDFLLQQIPCETNVSNIRARTQEMWILK
jgi:hypothetical protein